MSTKFFPALLKYWRARSGASQLDLALAADVSSRHISFLETGRASPSGSMLLRIMAALAVPAREQNQALVAAGFAPRFLEADLDKIDPAIDAALERMMHSHAPYPLTVMNASYDILRCNQSAKTIFSQFVAEPERLNAPLNLFDLVFDPGLARMFIQNWTGVAQNMVHRLHCEARLGRENVALWTLLERVLAYPGVPGSWRDPDFSLVQTPINYLGLQNDTYTLEFSMVVTKFLAAEQIMLDELRIESYFAVNEATRVACNALALAAAGGGSQG
ncbi:helix-turn-helix domain-containing protein [Rhodoferax sp.]|uniref:helix-turn-helix domain-containing protein n=1 Tax=Rhodoferax sp. TaxID=50421 RepID=UPI0025D72104|nr:helix-turn-helix domain-containing protein [Rhodoferax sp.]